MRKNGAKFVASKKPLHRMMKIIGMLKRQTWVTTAEMKEACAETEEMFSGPLLSCCTKTVLRDIRVLRQEYGAPVEYDAVEAAWRLTDPEWEFTTPALLGGTELLALTIGGRLAESIFPASVSGRVTAAVDEVLRFNAGSAGDLPGALFILSSEKPVMDGEIFRTVFEAWKQRRCIRIDYTDRMGKVTEGRVVEPQALVFFEMQWHLRGYCRLRKGPRTFQLTAVSKAEMMAERFEVDEELIGRVTPDDFLNYAKLPPAVIRLNRAGRQFAEGHRLHSGQKLIEEPGGESWRLEVPPVAAEQVVPWILRQCGNAVPLAPEELVTRIRETALRLAAGTGS